MANKKNEERKKPRKADISALDQAIAAAISAPPLSKKSAQYASGKKSRKKADPRKQDPKKLEPKKQEQKKQEPKKQEQKKQPCPQMIDPFPLHLFLLTQYASSPT